MQMAILDLLRTARVHRSFASSIADASFDRYIMHKVRTNIEDKYDGCFLGTFSTEYGPI